MTVSHTGLPRARSSGEVVRRRIASALITGAGVIHLVLAPEYLAETPWIGVLFVLAVPLTGGVAWRLWRTEDAPEDALGWLIGTALAVGMTAGFVLSRTVGLLGYTSDDWAEGIPALVLQVGFLVFAAARLRSVRSPMPHRPQ